MALHESIRHALEIPGQTTRRELHWLASLFADSELHAEVGCYCGRSLYVTCAAMQTGQVFAVDCYDLGPEMEYACMSVEWTKRVFLATMAEIQRESNVVIDWRADRSLEVARKLFEAGVQLDSVFLDANHGYDETKSDIGAWLQLVKPGGVLAGHDYWPQHPGVMRAVDECFEQFDAYDRIWWSRRA